jgi:folate-dependent phosphoribosylglycinamide formyltransferase PurN
LSDRSESLRVLVFTGGAVLDDPCVELAGYIDAHPELELAGLFCEARETGFRGVARDLLRRRGWLAPLLLVQRGLRRSRRVILAPRRALGRHRTLRRVAARTRFVPDLHAPEVLAEVAALRPDVGAVYGGPILRPALFTIPAQGCIGIHHGRLPDYRGKKTTFWAMYNGEATVGVAVQRIGAGLDRGDVLRDAVLEVGRKPLPVVTRRLERLGLQLFMDALLAIRRGAAEYRPQPPGARPLYRDPRGGDIARFWCRYVARLLAPRARSEGPGS